MIIPLLKSFRPVHWTKNLLLFAAPVFSLHIFQYEFFILSFSAFCLFCMISSGTYIFNDLLDISSDRNHPVKRNRPLASGEVKPVFAAIAALLLTAGGLALSFLLNRDFGFAALFYLVMSVSYSYKLKNVVILDVLIISSGFMVRAVAGTVIINVEISSWLLVCTIFLSLFIALCKRLNEFKLLENNNNLVTRKILKEYSPEMLTQFISISASAAAIAYTLYTVDAATIEKFGTRNLVYTVPFVIYGLFRYLYLIHKTDMGENPELVLLYDKGTLLNIVIYLITVIYILY